MTTERQDDQRLIDPADRDSPKLTTIDCSEGITYYEEPQQEILRNRCNEAAEADDLFLLLHQELLQNRYQDSTNLVEIKQKWESLRDKKTIDDSQLWLLAADIYGGQRYWQLLAPHDEKRLDALRTYKNLYDMIGQTIQERQLHLKPYGRDKLSQAILKETLRGSNDSDPKDLAEFYQKTEIARKAHHELFEFYKHEITGLTVESIDYSFFEKGGIYTRETSDQYTYNEVEGRSPDIIGKIVFKAADGTKYSCTFNQLESLGYFYNREKDTWKKVRYDEHGKSIETKEIEENEIKSKKWGMYFKSNPQKNYKKRPLAQEALVIWPEGLHPLQQPITPEIREKQKSHLVRRVEGRPKQLYEDLKKVVLRDQTCLDLGRREQHVGNPVVPATCVVSIHASHYTNYDSPGGSNILARPLCESFDHKRTFAPILFYAEPEVTNVAYTTGSTRLNTSTNHKEMVFAIRPGREQHYERFALLKEIERRQDRNLGESSLSQEETAKLLYLVNRGWGISELCKNVYPNKSKKEIHHLFDWPVINSILAYYLQTGETWESTATLLPEEVLLDQAICWVEENWVKNMNLSTLFVSYNEKPLSFEQLVELYVENKGPLEYADLISTYEDVQNTLPNKLAIPGLEGQVYITWLAQEKNTHSYSGKTIIYQPGEIDLTDDSMAFYRINAWPQVPQAQGDKKFKISITFQLPLSQEKKTYESLYEFEEERQKILKKHLHNENSWPERETFTLKTTGKPGIVFESLIKKVTVDNQDYLILPVFLPSRQLNILRFDSFSPQIDYNTYLTPAKNKDKIDEIRQNWVESMQAFTAEQKKAIRGFVSTSSSNNQTSWPQAREFNVSGDHFITIYSGGGNNDKYNILKLKLGQLLPLSSTPTKAIEVLEAWIEAAQTLIQANDEETATLNKQIELLTPYLSWLKKREAERNLEAEEQVDGFMEVIYTKLQDLFNSPEFQSYFDDEEPQYHNEIDVKQEAKTTGEKWPSYNGRGPLKSPDIIVPTIKLTKNELPNPIRITIQGPDEQEILIGFLEINDRSITGVSSMKRVNWVNRLGSIYNPGDLRSILTGLAQAHKSNPGWKPIFGCQLPGEERESPTTKQRLGYQTNDIEKKLRKARLNDPKLPQHYWQEAFIGNSSDQTDAPQTPKTEQEQPDNIITTDKKEATETEIREQWYYFCEELYNSLEKFLSQSDVFKQWSMKTHGKSIYSGSWQNQDNPNLNNETDWNHGTLSFGVGKKSYWRTPFVSITSVHKQDLPPLSITAFIEGKVLELGDLLPRSNRKTQTFNTECYELDIGNTPQEDANPYIGKKLRKLATSFPQAEDIIFTFEIRPQEEATDDSGDPTPESPQTSDTTYDDAGGFTPLESLEEPMILSDQKGDNRQEKLQKQTKHDALPPQLDSQIIAKLELGKGAGKHLKQLLKILPSLEDSQEMKQELQTALEKLTTERGTDLYNTNRLRQAVVETTIAIYESLKETNTPLTALEWLNDSLVVWKSLLNTLQEKATEPEQTPNTHLGSTTLAKMRSLSSSEDSPSSKESPDITIKTVEAIIQRLEAMQDSREHWDSLIRTTSDWLADDYPKAYQKLETPTGEAALLTFLSKKLTEDTIQNMDKDKQEEWVLDNIEEITGAIETD